MNAQNWMQETAKATESRVPVKDDFAWIPEYAQNGSIKPGDAIEIRTAQGDWLPATALSVPRVDRANAIKRHHYVSISVRSEGWNGVNWPVEDVRPAHPVEEERAPAAENPRGETPTPHEGP